MQGNEFLWLASVILGVTVVGWLVLDWLESAQHWDTYEDELHSAGTLHLGQHEQHAQNPLDVDSELMFGYPLDPFAPALMWRPQPQDEWIEMQEKPIQNKEAQQSGDLRTSEAS
jgi:hypothetical protein